MHKKALLATMLVSVLLFAGCLGFFESDSDIVEIVDESPLIAANEVDDINYGGLVYVSGTVTDELPTKARVTIAFSTLGVPYTKHLMKRVIGNIA